MLSRVRLCDPMNRSTPGLPVHHQLPEFTERGSRAGRGEAPAQLSPRTALMILLPVHLRKPCYDFYFLSIVKFHRLLSARPGPWADPGGTIGGPHKTIQSEMHIKTTMKYHLILVRMAIIKNLQTINDGEGVEKREPSGIVCGNVN